jgi:hypothetical protein
MMAWKGQRLPFDVGNQRVIMEDRDLIDLDLNRKKLVSFMRAAEQGKYYRPMDAVSRLATIQAASESLEEDSLLRALAQEVRDLRSTLTTAVQPRQFRRFHDTSRTIKRLIGTKVFRKELYPCFIDSGGTPKAWVRLLKTQVAAEDLERLQNWGVEEWKTYLATRAKELRNSEPAARSEYDTELMAKIRGLLPSQPWPDGIHNEIAGQLEIESRIVSKYISELIRRGDFVRQVDGKLFPEAG